MLSARAARVAAALDRRVLPAVAPARPALLRAVNGLYTTRYLARRIRMIKRVHRTDPELFAPVGPVRVLRRPLPAPLADGILYATAASAAAFTLGFKHRTTGPLHAGLLLWTLSYRNSWSMIFHSDNTLVLHAAVLGLSPAGDGAAVARASRPVAAASWRYAAPVRGMQTVTAVNYFLAGLAKVAGPLGWGWASGESLRRQIAADGLRKELLGSRGGPLGARLYSRTALFRVLAAGSLALELGAPLALLDRRLARLWALSAFGMHWGIFFTMGIRFRHQQSGVMYLPYFPIERLLPAAR